MYTRCAPVHLRMRTSTAMKEHQCLVHVPNSYNNKCITLLHS